MNNSYNIELFSEIYPLVKDFIFHYSAYHEIYSSLDLLSGDREFWVYSCDAHFKSATISWAMIFGSKDNETYWKNLFVDKEKASLDFKDFLDKHYNISNSKWENIRASTVRFRNNFVAHRNTDYNENVPFLSDSLEVVFAFDRWMRMKILPDIIDDELYENIYQKYCKSIKSTLFSAYSFKKYVKTYSIKLYLKVKKIFLNIKKRDAN